MTTQRIIFVTVLAFVLAAGSALSGCSSATTKPTTRHLASAEDAIIRKFATLLVKDSSLGSEGAVEDAMNQLVKDNADKLSVKKVSSLEDIAELSDADQKRIIEKMVRLPGFEKIVDNPDAVQAARREAIDSLETKNVTTEPVRDIHAQSSTTDSASEDLRFTSATQKSPELKSDADLIVSAGNRIKQKTGTTILDNVGCNKLQEPESVQNLATIMSGVDHDVAAGDAKDTPGVAQSLEKNTEYTLGTDKPESHRRICALADRGGCRVFTPEMCQ